MSQEIKVYKVVELSSKYQHDTEVVIKSDHDQALAAKDAEIAELKELIKREVVPDIKDAEIARLKEENEQNGLIVYGRKIETLNNTIRVLEARIKTALATLNVLANRGETMKLRYEPQWYEDLASGTIDELSAINIDSIKRGEK